MCVARPPGRTRHKGHTRHSLIWTRSFLSNDVLPPAGTTLTPLCRRSFSLERVLRNSSHFSFFRGRNARAAVRETCPNYHIRNEAVSRGSIAPTWPRPARGRSLNLQNTSRHSKRRTLLPPSQTSHQSTPGTFDFHKCNSPAVPPRARHSRLERGARARATERLLRRGDDQLLNVRGSAPLDLGSADVRAHLAPLAGGRRAPAALLAACDACPRCETLSTYRRRLLLPPVDRLIPSGRSCAGWPVAGCGTALDPRLVGTCCRLLAGKESKRGSDRGPFPWCV